MNSSGGVPVTCKNCGHIFEGNYCNQCGEKVYTRHDSTMLHLVEEGAHFITHFEGSFFNTLKALTVPGKLATDYCNGIRKRYFKPISFFLLVIVLYLLFPLAEGLNQRLSYHLVNPFYGGYATKKLEHVLQHTGLTIQQASDIFHQKSEKASKFLLLILIPASALILQIFTFKKHRLFFDQVILATEINTSFILLAFFILSLFIKLIYLLVHFFATVNDGLIETFLGLFLVPLILLYTYRAIRRFYGFKGLQAALLTIAFIILYGFFFQFIYKFVLFEVVIWQVH